MVWESSENSMGGVKDAERHPVEMNKGTSWDILLLKIILKPIKAMIKYKKIKPISKKQQRDIEISKSS